MLCTRKRDAQPIPGYRLLEPLGKGGCGEVWKCLAPGDLVKAIKFVASDPMGLMSEMGPDKEHEAVERVKSIRHPFLLTMDRVEIIDGELIIVMEMADCSLRDLLNRRRAAGFAGLEREPLLDFLGEAANALDFMAQRCGLQHLDIKPENLFVVADHVKVADFGLVQNLSDDTGVTLHALTPRYAAPELFQNRISASCDQYSLAIVFVELLTGTLPFDGKSNRQLVMQRANAVPSLDALNDADRAIITRALDAEPSRRFATCTELVNALLNAQMLATAVSPTEMFNSNNDTTREGVAAPKAIRPTPPRPAVLPLPVRNTLSRYLPDFKLRRVLGRTPTSESWEAETDRGTRYLVRLLYGVVGRDAEREQQAIERLKQQNHPVLQPIHITPAGPGQLLVVTELADETVVERLASGGPDEERHVRKERLLDWLWPIAEGLDELAREQGLAHLGLQPRVLVVKESLLRVADFGMLPLLFQPAGQLKTQVRPRYVAPEVVEGYGSNASDQYSLAVIYQELLTGQAPWRDRPTGPPDLSAMTAVERDVLARAFDKDPSRRFPNILAMLEALDRSAARSSVIRTLKSSPKARRSYWRNSWRACAASQARASSSITSDGRRSAGCGRSH
jgi:serine/threonine protein kinase